MPRSFCPCGGVIEGRTACPACGRGGKRVCTHTKTTKQRGYDHRWRKLSEKVRAEQPLCVDCLERGMVKPAVDCHHIVPIASNQARRMDRSNVVPLCRACHTERERTAGCA